MHSIAAIPSYVLVGSMQKTQGTTEWLEAADCGWIHLVELLISIGAEVDLKDSMVSALPQPNHRQHLSYSIMALQSL